MEKHSLKKISEDILASKKFSRIDSNVIERVILSSYEESSKAMKKLLDEDYATYTKKKQYKAFLKKVKTELHEIYAVYQTKKGKTENILALMKKTKHKEKLIELHKELLHQHTSTRERKKDYELFYELLFEQFPKIKTVLDIGCGLNVFSLIFSKKKLSYKGYDISTEDATLCTDYLKTVGKTLGFKGQVSVGDIHSKKDLRKICEKQYDLCLLLKMTDMLDYGVKHHKRTEAFIRQVKAKHLVVSFPLRTISNKLMKNPERKWFKLMLKRLNYTFTIEDLHNEQFYFITKNKDL